LGITTVPIGRGALLTLTNSGPPETVGLLVAHILSLEIGWRGDGYGGRDKRHGTQGGEAAWTRGAPLQPRIVRSMGTGRVEQLRLRRWLPENKKR
jgi:hypothetical protein